MRKDWKLGRLEWLMRGVRRAGAPAPWYNAARLPANLREQ